MATISRDTNPRAEAVTIELLRRMTPVQQLERSISSGGWRSRWHARASSRSTPTLHPAEVKLRLASLWLERETTMRVYGWDPDVAGY